MYKKIAVIGLGALGGFVAKSISDLETTKELLIVDYDKVEKKNLISSIYRKKDIGKFKVDCLNDIIKSYNDSISINPINCKFIEGETIIPDCDLVIDCRDYVYDRGDIIDVRMYISSRYLVVDCRGNTNYQKHYQGRYITELTKTDMRNAGFNASLLIYKELIDELIKRRTIYELELDQIDRSMSECINLLEDKRDMVYEVQENADKLLNLDQNIHPIMDMNKNSDITVYVGDRKQPMSTALVPRNTLRNYYDVISCLTSSVRKPACSFNYFIVSPNVNNGKNEIELLPETGAA